MLILLIYIFTYKITYKINQENFKGKSSALHSWCNQGMNSHYEPLYFESTNQPVPPEFINKPVITHTICAQGECNDGNCGCKCAQGDVYKNPNNLGSLYQSEEEIRNKNEQIAFEEKCKSFLCRFVKNSQEDSELNLSPNNNQGTSWRKSIIDNIINGNYTDEIKLISECNDKGLLKLSNYYNNCT